MSDGLTGLTNEKWYVSPHSIEQVWLVVSNPNIIKELLTQTSITFINNDTLVLYQSKLTVTDFKKHIIWENVNQQKLSLSFELIQNTLENSTLVHTVISFIKIENNSFNETYDSEFSEISKIFFDLVEDFLKKNIINVVNYQSIIINCHIKELFQFITSWEFVKVAHSSITEVKIIDKSPTELNAVIECICKNGASRCYQVNEVCLDINESIMKYNLKEVDFYKKNNDLNQEQTIDNTSDNSNQIRMTMAKSGENSSFLSIEHVIIYKKIQLLLNQKCIHNLMKDKKCMLIEIKTFLEENSNSRKANVKKTSNEFGTFE